MNMGMSSPHFFRKQELSNTYQRIKGLVLRKVERRKSIIFCIMYYGLLISLYFTTNMSLKKKMLAILYVRKGDPGK